MPEIVAAPAGKVLFFFLFSMLHSCRNLGVWRATVFLVVALGISWGFEQLGVMYSVPFGSYYYTDYLGPRLGQVPVAVPLAWFMMAYPCYIMARLTLGPWKGSQGKTRPGMALAALAALYMVAWDLSLDPYASGPSREAWVWEEPGVYFGVPLQNFVGWFIASFSIFGIFEWIQGPKGRGRFCREESGLAIVAYALMMLAIMASAEPMVLRGIALVGMGTPLWMALRGYRRNSPRSSVGS